MLVHGWFFPRSIIWYFSLLNFMRFQSAYFSILLSPLLIVALPSTLLTVPLILYYPKICSECFPSIHQGINKNVKKKELTPTGYLLNYHTLKFIISTAGHKTLGLMVLTIFHLSYNPPCKILATVPCRQKT